MTETAQTLSPLQKLQQRTSFRIYFFIALACFTVSVFFFSLSQGAVNVAFSDILKAVFSFGSEPGSEIIWHVRFPRILLACLVGASLSVSGAILQAVMRNPLASPGIIGVSAGGGLGALIVIIVMPYYFNLLVPAAFAGAVITTFLIYMLAWRQGVHPMHLILAGVAVASLLSAISNSLMIMFPDRIQGTIDFMVGSLTARSWRHVNMILPYSLAGVAVSLTLARRINILMLGDDMAASLGLNVERTRVVLIALSSLLAASAVSVVGLIGFVGLIVPHMMRLIIGSDHRFLLPACIIFSPGLLMACDTLGRLIMRPVEVPAGIMMALLGAPFFLFLLSRKKAL